MLHKFLASWLVVLVVVPFTAPFSTCRLSSLVAKERGASQPLAPRRTSAATGATIMRLVRGTTRRRDDLTLDEVAVIPNLVAARMRLRGLTDAPLEQARFLSSSTRVTWRAAAGGQVRSHVVLATVLRV